MRETCIGLLACVIAVSASTPAQDDVFTRRRCLGVARAADGSTAPGVRAHFRLIAPNPLVLDRLADDHDVVADDQGRFHAELIVGREYIVWTEEAPDVHGAAHLSEVWTARARARVSPVLLPHRTAPTRMQLRDFGPGALRLRIFDPQIHQIDDIDVPADGRLTLPPRPDSVVWMQVTRDEKLLACVQVFTGADRVIARSSSRPARIQVNAGPKLPLADATMTLVCAGRSLVIATTGSDGAAEFDSGIFGARVDDHDVCERRLECIVGALTSLRILTSPTTLVAGASGAVPVLSVLAPSPLDSTPIEVRVGVRPLRNATFLTENNLRLANNSDRSVDRVTDVLHTDGAGRIDHPELVDWYSSLRLVLDRASLAQLPASWSSCARTVASIPAPTEGTPRKIDLLELLKPIDLDVITSDGSSPAFEVELWVGRGTERASRATTDRAGRIRLLVPSTLQFPLLVSTCAAEGYGVVTLDPGTEHLPEDRIPNLRMELRKTLRVDLQPPANPASPPIPRRVVHVRSRFTVDHATIQANQVAVPPRERTLHATAIAAPPVACLGFLRPGGDGQEFESPRFAVYLPPLPGKLELTAESTTLFGKTEVQILGDEDPVTVELGLTWR